MLTVLRGQHRGSRRLYELSAQCFKIYGGVELTRRYPVWAVQFSSWYAIGDGHAPNRCQQTPCTGNRGRSYMHIVVSKLAINSHCHMYHNHLRTLHMLSALLDHKLEQDVVVHGLQGRQVHAKGVGYARQVEAELQQ